MSEEKIPPIYDLETYTYELPEELIAQYPSQQREESRLLVIDRGKKEIIHHDKFAEIEKYFREGDLLVANDTRVFPARLYGQKETGGKVEVLLLRLPEKGKPVPALHRGKKIKKGSLIKFEKGLVARVLENLGEGKILISLEGVDDVLGVLYEIGNVPLPPYIKREPKKEDFSRYQTVYAKKLGSVAAPTAGLHFSEELLNRLQEKSVKFITITLHVGYGTFEPVKVRDIRKFQIHEEYVEISPEVAELINTSREEGRRLFAIGTTTMRTLEFAARRTGKIEPISGWCDLYIYPGFEFKAVDHLITNFHLPKSSLLVLVAAFAGLELTKKAYQEAVAKRYRFFSYGDATLIL
ncbi:S-adenosylmethionine/tRNA-ribosyltransferase-isomerase [Thermodesulfatator indicus DSM 15286]|uniref:S-adenosylmethionine:tRNA ribosyltransferase-isomerase n=1 Tax=Thermodesulfatator indicus (strain DSM 15286 / JCM 11887 / CIR29812) TaxID=667014 RepID=F8ADY0_THEID|nr:tRNA preQ1(34) S-adenosylmethionine ribosyltransferase-isomerase QueA [Thermodesulfatator indicus]AEH44945.1 S-adenosylmethionine/tRNA-ribosyltransferase-isomerase [Thermodesulfatator indicus DSM 15286]